MKGGLGIGHGAASRRSRQPGAPEGLLLGPAMIWISTPTRPPFGNAVCRS